jgi:hypothetical protein
MMTGQYWLKFWKNLLPQTWGSKKSGYLKYLTSNMTLNPTGHESSMSILTFCRYFKTCLRTQCKWNSITITEIIVISVQACTFCEFPYVNKYNHKILRHFLHLINKWLPVIPAGGITTRPSSPNFANIFRISAAEVLAGRFFARITVLDLCFGAWNKQIQYNYISLCKHF